MYHHFKFVLVSALFLTISACTSLSGDWPNLAEPYPVAADNQRVIERAKPTKPMRDTETPVLTRSAAFKLFESTRARFEANKTTYLAAKAKITESTGEDQLDNWNEAQLSLTRLSHTLSRLDGILSSETLSDAPVFASTRTFKETQDVFLVSERQMLARLKP